LNKKIEVKKFGKIIVLGFTMIEDWLVIMEEKYGYIYFIRNKELEG